MNYPQLIAYFLIGGGLSNIIMVNNFSIGRFMQQSIKTGSLNMYLIRPIQLLPYLGASAIGQRGLQIIIAFIRIIIGVWIFPPSSFVAFILFIVALCIAILISLSFNILVGIFGFITTESGSIRNVITHVTRVFAGSFVPISFFPPILQKIALFSPFPAMIYGPTSTLQSNEFGSQFFIQLGINFLWGIGLLFITIYIWNKMLKKYEAIGI